MEGYRDERGHGCREGTFPGHGRRPGSTSRIVPPPGGRNAVLSCTSSRGTLSMSFLFVAALSVALAFPGAPALEEREDKLPEPYRKWLREEGTYIITEVER